MRQAVSGDFSTATDLADYLARRGLPFREAHAVVGRLVQLCLDQGKSLEDLSLKELQQASTLFEPDALAALTPEAAVAARTSSGGTALEQVKLPIGPGESVSTTKSPLPDETGFISTPALRQGFFESPNSHRVILWEEKVCFDPARFRRKNQGRGMLGEGKGLVVIGCVGNGVGGWVQSHPGAPGPSAGATGGNPCTGAVVTCRYCHCRCQRSGIRSGLLIGVAKGYYPRAGLNIESVNFNTGQEMINALAAGQLDVGFTVTASGLFNAMLRGIPIKIVADRRCQRGWPGLLPGSASAKTWWMKSKTSRICAGRQISYCGHSLAGRELLWIAASMPAA